MHEFEIIKNYFAAHSFKRADTILSIGDDAAIISVPANHWLSITTDTLISNVHFPAQTPPQAIGYKSLAVNLSDLAAMGAHASWVTLALTLPQPDEAWIKAFCEGFFTLTDQFNVQLIGGDLTKGPLSITVQAMGLLPQGMGLLRKNAKPGDLIYVTGTLGDAGAALRNLQVNLGISEVFSAFIRHRLDYPTPRLKEGEALLPIAHAAIDVSDGLIADLGHILEASKVGAKINVDHLPLSEALQTLNKEQALAYALTSGDDYELCFTIPAEKRVQLESTFSTLSTQITCIGEITQQLGLTLHYQNGQPYHGTKTGYQHF